MNLPTTTMTPETAAKLRDPFDPKHIKYIQKGGARLAYVGHAQITDRLLAVDPLWNWEPLATTPEGLPLFDDQGGIWIKLTIAGVTRLGYGDAQGKKGPNAIKEAIGDGLRNAAMRFGVALDLWGASREDDITAAASEPQPAAVDNQEIAAALFARIDNSTNREQLVEAWRAINEAEVDRNLTQQTAEKLREHCKAVREEILPS